MKIKNHWDTISKIPSKRRYAVYLSHNDSSPVKHTLQEMLNYSLTEDYEWAHAMMDILDDIMDLRIMEAMYFEPNRDDKNSRRELGIIKRIS